VPVAVLAIVVPLAYTCWRICGQDGRNYLPTFVNTPLLILELLHRNGLFPVITVVLDRAILCRKRQLFELENQIIASRHVGLAPYITHVTREPTDEEGADKVNRKGHRSVTAFMLPTLQLGCMRDPPRSGRLADESNRIPHGERTALGIRIIHKSQIDHELLPVVCVALVPVALQAGQDVINSHHINNRINHARELQPLECGDVTDNGPPSIDAKHETDVTYINRVA
jgi:hypothetical protein